MSWIVFSGMFNILEKCRLHLCCCSSGESHTFPFSSLTAAVCTGTRPLLPLSDAAPHYLPSIPAHLYLHSFALKPSILGSSHLPPCIPACFCMPLLISLTAGSQPQSIQPVPLLQQWPENCPTSLSTVSMPPPHIQQSPHIPSCQISPDRTTHSICPMCTL